MKKILNQPRLPTLLLRLGLAVVFAYAAISSFLNPEDWVGYLPEFLTDTFDANILLKLFSTFELVLAIWLVSGWATEIAGLVSAAMLGGIVILNLSLLEITFRDIGLVFASLALYCLASQNKARGVDAKPGRP